MDRIPEHIAIIMDGNGRWARKRNLPRVMGHREGVKTADLVIEACARLGVKALTMYTFSTENWKRPQEEISALMDLLEKSIFENSRKLNENNIKFNVIGRPERFTPSLRKALEDLIMETSSNTGMTLSLALNYGGRREILDAAKAFSAEILKGKDPETFEEGDFARFLYTRDLPEVDLMIRTSGEMRVSNFLLWQIAYAEIYVTDTLWPDFRQPELMKAIKEYSARERRFGA
ncbi:MAG: isoprenyl transferase [Candidatus Omnitrophica bacterium]|jgi:undecaprenyl diphosphate synthase|nr:isoprenyl transferase [Candidatus Omnitrophota bacterium]